MITIAWDVDDVLNNLTECWLKYYNSNNNTSFDYNDITKNPPHEILNISFEKYIESLDEFRMSEYAQQLVPNQDILDFMDKHKDRFNHIALTATSAHTAYNSSYWVLKNFYKYVFSYNVVPAKRDYLTYSNYSDKKSFLQQHSDVKILIDDSIKNVEDANSIGVKAYLLKRPWNEGMEINEIFNEIERSAV